MSESIAPKLNWGAPNGGLLMTFIKGLPRGRSFTLNVFGSTALQLHLDPSFVSADVDIFSTEDLTQYVKELRLGKGQSDLYIEILPESIFITSPAWRDRASRAVFENVTVYVASPLDVLVGKLKRLEEKDLRAFDLVKNFTGGPTEATLLHALRQVVDMYRPAFDEENSGGDAIANTRRLWMHLYGRDIDVRAEIITPAIKERSTAYGFNTPDRRSVLREMAE